MERLVTATLVGIALFWAGACFWIRGDGIPDWWLPVAFAASISVASRLPAQGDQTSPSWSRAVAWAVIGTVFAVLWLGAVATPSRHWDGAASFDAKVFWLTDSPALVQPFFAAQGVFHHSPDYPLLLPMLIAMVERLAPEFGRIVLPLIYLLLCGLVTSALQRRRIAPLLRVAITVAVAVTPALLTPGGGAVDSGYAECLMLLAATTVAAGLLNRDALWFATGMVLLIAAKPEGQAYAVVALAVAFARFERPVLVPGIVALLVACTIWEPVKAALLHRDSRPWMSIPLVVVVGFSGLALAITRLAPGLAAKPACRWAMIFALPVVGLLVLPWIAPLFAEGNGTVALYMRQASGVFTGLADLPAYFASLLEFGVSRLRVGTSLLIPIVAIVVAKLRGMQLADRSVMAFAGLGLATTALPFVLSPEPDVEHHLRSSLTRLLLHWVGALWLLNACWLQAIVFDAPAPTGQQSTP